MGHPDPTSTAPVRSPSLAVFSSPTTSPADRRNVAITVHRDSYHGDDNSLDLRYLLYVRIEGGRMAEVWEVPFDQAENNRHFGVQAATFARLAAPQQPGSPAMSMGFV